MIRCRIIFFGFRAFIFCRRITTIHHALITKTVRLKRLPIASRFETQMMQDAHISPRCRTSTTLLHVTNEGGGAGSVD